MPAKRMTLEQFLVALERTTRGPKALKWYRNQHGCIRGNNGRCICCPITAVGGGVPVYQWFSAARDLRLDLRMAKRLLVASDKFGATEHPRLRRRLLKALHLTEVGHG